jgi:hypothetical protein
MFQQVIVIIRESQLPQRILRQYLYCGCIWITIRPVWSVVVGCNQECIVGSFPAGTEPIICAKISPPPGFDPWTVQPVAIRYTD